MRIELESIASCCFVQPECGGLVLTKMCDSLLSLAGLDSSLAQVVALFLVSSPQYMQYNFFGGLCPLWMFLPLPRPLVELELKS